MSWSSEMKMKANLMMLLLQNKKNLIFHQFFSLSKHSREEIGLLVEINHIESDCMSEYDKIGWNCVGTPRQLKLIKGDGNCYFRAISYAISGTEDFHDKVRETLCDYIEYFDYDVAPFLKFYPEAGPGDAGKENDLS